MHLCLSTLKKLVSKRGLRGWCGKETSLLLNNAYFHLLILSIISFNTVSFTTNRYCFYKLKKKNIQCKCMNKPGICLSSLIAEAIICLWIVNKTWIGILWLQGKSSLWYWIYHTSESWLPEFRGSLRCLVLYLIAYLIVRSWKPFL